MAAAASIVAMQRTVVYIRGVPTERLWWPRATTARAAAASNVHHRHPSQTAEGAMVPTFVMIPGNPGAVDFYIDFLSTIHRQCQGALEIFAGHPTIEPMHVEEQIEHKLRFLEELHAENPQRRFILAGHSVGAYICLQILKAQPVWPVDRVFCLFPTIHNIGDTPNGRRLMPVFAAAMRYSVSSIASALRWLPLSARQLLVRTLTAQSDDNASITAGRLLDGNVCNNCLYMAGTEMDHIRELDESLVEAHLPKLSFIYSRIDGWVPMAHHDRIKERFPEADVYLCGPEVPHAFVLGHSESVGLNVAATLRRHLAANFGDSLASWSAPDPFRPSAHESTATAHDAAASGAGDGHAHGPSHHLVSQSTSALASM